MLKLNAIYNEDCLQGMQRIADKSVDLILCDLPYGTTNCKWDSIIPFEPLWAQYERVIKPNGAIVLTASQPFTTKLIASGFEHYRHSWVWVKSRPTGFQRVSFEPMRSTEDVCVFYKRTPHTEMQADENSLVFKKWLREQLKKSGITGKKLNAACGFEASGYLRTSSSWANVLPSQEKIDTILKVMGVSGNDVPIFFKTQGRTFNQQGIRSYNKKNRRGKTGENWSEMAIDVYEQSHTGYPTNVLYFDVETGIHPTQKPVALMEYMILTYSNEGETVLDNCIGSGTTAIAAINTNRNYIGFEKDITYHALAEERVRKHIEVKSIPVYDLFNQAV